MESTWPAIFTFLSVFTFAIVSPGPNFILVTNTTLGSSRRAGLFTALGVATGSGLFALAGLAGLLVLVHSLPYFALIMPFVGGAYLAWIGFDMLRNCRCHANLETTEASTEMSATGCPAFISYKTGLLTNLTNPKAWAFYLSLFTLVMTPNFPLWGKVVLNVAMFLISLAWYATVAILISSRTFQPIFLNWRPLIQGVLGLLLMLLGGKVLLT
jgi:threonine/homoserine/homoserine lactone efflux protein